MQKALNTIAVDLTPVLPGGENGGAKIFVLELLQHLAKMAPNTQFILLTQALSHDELAFLDRPNMWRKIVMGPIVNNSLRNQLTVFVYRITPYFPISLRNFINHLSFKFNFTKKQGSSGSLLRDLNVDLLYCPFTAPTFFELGIPTVCTIYDLQHKTYPEFFTVEDVVHRDRIFNEACLRADALSVISNYSRSTAIIHGKLDPDCIRTIYMRIAQRFSSGTGLNEKILNQLGLAPKQFLLYPANFWKHKNHEMLITAFGIACHEGLADNIKLVCTGAPGQRQEWLKRAAQTMGLGDRVVFPGFISNDDLASLIDNATGVVFPSLYEGFGLPVIEAMEAGVPVACSNTTTLPEVAADAAILFDPRIPTQIAKAMISLVENKVLRNQLIQAGRTRAMYFSDTDKLAQEYWELFQYAMINKKTENMMTGVFADGWIGPILYIQIAPSSSLRSLEIEFSTPAWLPNKNLTIQAFMGGKTQGLPVQFNSGDNANLSLPLETTGGFYEVRVHPSFVPSISGIGDDKRELSAVLERCDIICADDKCIELFSKTIH